MNIVLPPTLEEYIASLLKTGGYEKADEVVTEALREHQAQRQGIDVVMTPKLERLLEEGLENLEMAKTTDELRQQK